MNNPLLQPDPGLFVWTILTFLILLAILAKFAWNPLLKALEERRNTINKALEDAQQARVELERLGQQSAEILRKARADAEAGMSQTRTDAERRREGMRHKARGAAGGIVRHARKRVPAPAPP